MIHSNAIVIAGMEYMHYSAEKIKKTCDACAGVGLLPVIVTPDYSIAPPGSVLFKPSAFRAETEEIGLIKQTYGLWGRYALILYGECEYDQKLLVDMMLCQQSPAVFHSDGRVVGMAFKPEDAGFLDKLNDGEEAWYKYMVDIGTRAPAASLITGWKVN